MLNKKIALTSLIFLLILWHPILGLTQNPTDPNFGNDFQPPQEPLRGQVEGPWDKRLMTAYSDDGLSFIKTNQVISDQANVPDLMALPNGRIILYYTGGSVGDKKQLTVAAISADNGKTWTHKYITISGFENGPVPGDPDIVKLDDGSFRLFITCGDPTSPYPKIFWADSQDGIHFVKGGIALEQSTEPVMDSFTVKIGDTWHMYTLTTQPDKLFHATSIDAKTFTLLGKVSFRAENDESYWVGNEIKIENGFRFYGFSLHPSNIRSFTTKNGLNWQIEPGIRLPLEQDNQKESRYVRDPAVIQLSNGKFLMVYVTKIPGS